MGIFHVRVQKARDDFVLLGPISEDGKDTAHGGIVVGEGGVKDYTWFVLLLFLYPSHSRNISPISILGRCLGLKANLVSDWRGVS